MFSVWSFYLLHLRILFAVRFTAVTARLAKPEWPRSSPAIPADKFCHSADLPLLSIARPAIFARRPLEVLLTYLYHCIVLVNDQFASAV